MLLARRNFWFLASRNLSSTVGNVGSSKRRISISSNNFGPGTSYEFGSPLVSFNGSNKGDFWKDGRFSSRLFATAASHKMESSSNQENIEMETLRKEVLSILDDLEVDFTMRGQVNGDTFTALLSKLKQSDFPLTNIQSLFLIRCCGDEMFAEKTDVRLRLLDELWALLPSLGIKYSIAHFNHLLSAWKENNHKFSVVDFLSELEKHADVQLDATTYQYILMRYCMDGDIDGATTVLEEMKSKEYSISEKVINALVYGYAKNGDTKGVQNVFKAMNASGVKISWNTYFNMALPYDERGDMETIKKIHAEASESEYFGITERDCFELVQALSMNGHSSKIPEKVLEKLPCKPATIARAHRAALQLILLGKAPMQYRRSITTSSDNRIIINEGKSDRHKAEAIVKYIAHVQMDTVKTQDSKFALIQSELQKMSEKLEKLSDDLNKTISENNKSTEKKYMFIVRLLITILAVVFFKEPAKSAMNSLETLMKTYSNEMKVVSENA